MATFFDPDDIADFNLLHSDVRNHEQLNTVVDKVEYEVLDYYSQRPSIPLTLRTGRENLYTSNDISVRLIDYDQDTPADSPADLKDALRRTIADVTSWVLRNYDSSQGVGQITQGKRSITFVGSAPDWRQWPEGWQRYLKNYDDREAVYSI